MTMKKIGYFLLTLLAIFCLQACADDDAVVDSGYGYVQFHVVKADTRATATQLESLAEAAKVRVVLTHEGTAITQTLLLRRYSDQSAEFGLQSDKLKLLAGSYRVTGFYLYNALDEEIYSNAAGSDATFDIVPDGLHYQRLEVDAIVRGMASFRLTKRFVETRAGDAPEYPFSSINGVSFTVENIFTHEVRHIDKVRVTVIRGFEQVDRHTKETTYGKCDTLVWLPVGTYKVTGYTTYSDNRFRYMLETATVKNAPTFVVEAHETTEEADVPIFMVKSSERLKAYVALKALWEALDGAHWSYKGEAETPGTNWDFDKDMDLWGVQPGI